MQRQLLQSANEWAQLVSKATMSHWSLNACLAFKLGHDESILYYLWQLQCILGYQLSLNFDKTLKLWSQLISISLSCHLLWQECNTGFIHQKRLFIQRPMWSRCPSKMAMYTQKWCPKIPSKIRHNQMTVHSPITDYGGPSSVNRNHLVVYQFEYYPIYTCFLYSRLINTGIHSLACPTVKKKDGTTKWQEGTSSLLKMNN